MKRVLMIPIILILVLSAACQSTATETPTSAPPQPVATDTQAASDLATVSVEQVQNTTWQWASDGQTAIPDPQNYNIVLFPDLRFSFKADCNNGVGAYAASGSNLTLQLGATTLAECGENSQSTGYLQKLASVTSFGMRGDQLVLVVDGGATTMSFINAGPAAPPETQPAPPPFADFTWYWQGTNLTNGAQVLVANPSGYSIRFLSDGTLEGQADCNTFSGGYTIAENNLTIQLGPSTLVACPEGSLGSDYLQQLSQVAGYTLQGESLSLDLAADAGMMIFNQQPVTLTPDPTPTFTQVPPTPTSTPRPVVIVPTATATKPPTTSTNQCKVVSARPQGVKLEPGQTDADMRAELKNVSDKIWKGNEIDFVLTGKINGVKIHKGADVWDLGVDVAPDGTYTFSLDLLAPDEEGTFGETWAMKLGGETLCSWSITIVVEK